MHWWQIPLALVVGAIGTYLWAVPSSAFQEHMRKLYAWLRQPKDEMDRRQDTSEVQPLFTPKK